jgi:hypothetical protein
MNSERYNEYDFTVVDGRIDPSFGDERRKVGYVMARASEGQSLGYGVCERLSASISLIPPETLARGPSWNCILHERAGHDANSVEFDGVIHSSFGSPETPANQLRLS